MATDYTQEASCVMALLMRADEDPLTDSSGEGNTAALKGAGEPNYTTDVPTGYAEGSYDFDGTDDYVLVASDASLDNMGDFTFVTWVKIDDLDVSLGRFYHKALTGGDFYASTVSSNRLNIEISTDGTSRQSVTNTSAYNLGEWIHVAFVYSVGTAPDIFVNAVEVSYATHNAGTGSDDDNSGIITYIGNSSSFDRGIDGHFKETAFFNTVLTEAQINEIMDFGLDGSLAPGGIMTPRSGYWGDL
jgi:hypothetical protein